MSEKVSGISFAPGLMEHSPITYTSALRRPLRLLSFFFHVYS